MTTNLLDALQGMVTPQLLAAASSRFGEPESSISKGLGAALPLILGGLAQKSNDPSAMSQIMSLFTSRTNSSDIVAHPARVLANDAAAAETNDITRRLLAMLFSGQTSSVTGALADYAGISNSSASSLMTLAGTLATSFFGDRIRREGLSANTLAGLLDTDHNRIARALPAGLSGAAGLSALRDVASRVGATASATRSETPRGWLWAAAAALLVAFGAWALWGRSEAPQIARPTADAVRAAQDAVRRSGQAAGDAAQRAGQAAGDAAQAARQSAGDAVQHAGQVAGDAIEEGQIALAKLGSLTTRRLPTNVELSVPERGVESSVIAYIEDPSSQLEPAVWFNFDRLLFETGSATLKPYSQEQLKNVAEIMKAYPSVQIKIGGYTDNVGDPTANQKLSQDRAANVSSAIIAMGIAPDRLSAEGFGEQFPVADNATPEGRQQNRRIALRLTGK